MTYFRNDYQNKIVAGDNVIGQTASGAYILKVAEWRESSGGRYRSQYVFPTGERSSELEYQCHMDDHFGAKDTGNPLSVIPKYTINNSLNWTITQAFSANVNWTLYGRQNRVLMRKPAVKILAVCQVKSWALIHWWGRTSITILIKICVLMSASVISSINRSSDLLKGRIPITSQAGLIMPELPHHSDRSVSGALPA